MSNDSGWVHNEQIGGTTPPPKTKREEELEARVRELEAALTSTQRFSDDQRAKHVARVALSGEPKP